MVAYRGSKVRSWQKNLIFGKYKMAATDQIVHLTKKFRKQKSSVSLSYPWNGPKFLTLDQNLRSYSQKTDFQVFGLKKFPPKIKIFETAASKLLDIFWFFSLCSLKVYIPRDTEWKFCPPIYSLGHSGPFWVWGLIYIYISALSLTYCNLFINAFL